MSRLLDYFFVPKCAICHERMDKMGNGICKRCNNVYEDEKAEYCDICGMEISRCRCVPPLLYMSGIYFFRRLVFYKPKEKTPVIKGILYSIKKNNSLDLMKFLAKELANSCDFSNFDEMLVTYTPRTHYSYKKYGYDQAKILALAFSKVTGAKFKKLICRKHSFSSGEQKKLTNKQRIKNIKDQFYIRNTNEIMGKTIILIDDVVTSGATIAECAKELYSAGAVEIRVLCIAQTYKKKQRKKD